MQGYSVQTMQWFLCGGSLPGEGHFSKVGDVHKHGINIINFRWEITAVDEITVDEKANFCAVIDTLG